MMLRRLNASPQIDNFLSHGGARDVESLVAFAVQALPEVALLPLNDAMLSGGGGLDMTRFDIPHVLVFFCDSVANCVSDHDRRLVRRGRELRSGGSMLCAPLRLRWRWTAWQRCL